MVVEWAGDIREKDNSLYFFEVLWLGVRLYKSIRDSLLFEVMTFVFELVYSVEAFLVKYA